MTNAEIFTLITDERDSWGAASAAEELMYFTDKKLRGVRRGIDMDVCGADYTERLIRAADRELIDDDRSWTGLMTRVMTATGPARRAA